MDGDCDVKKAQAEPEREHGHYDGSQMEKQYLTTKANRLSNMNPIYTTGHKFEEPVEVGVTPVMYYDSAGPFDTNRNARWLIQPCGVYSLV